MARAACNSLLALAFLCAAVTAVMLLIRRHRLHAGRPISENPAVITAGRVVRSFGLGKSAVPSGTEEEHPCAKP